jgi:hypothetical protein
VTQNKNPNSDVAVRETVLLISVAGYISLRVRIKDEVFADDEPATFRTFAEAQLFRTKNITEYSA